MSDCKSLFEPADIGGTPLRNRIVMAPMTRTKSPGGIPGSDVAAYYRRRARAEVGLIITEGVSIDHPGAAALPDVPQFYGQEALAAWKVICSLVHGEGGRIVPQLWHVGAMRRASEGIGPAPGYGPVEIVENNRVVVNGLSDSEIDRICSAYAQTARDAQQIGFDGVEIHGAHGYLIDQFMRRSTNTRKDSFGGSTENRLHFAKEVVRRIRKAVPSTFPVIFRFSQWTPDDYNARLVETPQALGELIGHLCEAGVDAFHVSTRRFWEPAFEGSTLCLAGWTRKLANRTVIAVGSVGLDKPHQSRKQRLTADLRSSFADLGHLAQCVEEGQFDLVAVGRGLLADPDWVTKVRSGRAEDLIPVSAESYANLIF